MTVSFQGMNDPVLVRAVEMYVTVGFDGGNFPINESVTLYFMSDGTVRWKQP